MGVPRVRRLGCRARQLPRPRQGSGVEIHQEGAHVFKLTSHVLVTARSPMDYIATSERGHHPLHEPPRPGLGAGPQADGRRSREDVLRLSRADPALGRTTTTAGRNDRAQTLRDLQRSKPQVGLAARFPGLTTLLRSITRSSRRSRMSNSAAGLSSNSTVCPTKCERPKRLQ